MTRIRRAAVAIAVLGMTAAGCGSQGITLGGKADSTTTTVAASAATTAGTATTAVSTTVTTKPTVPAGWKTIKGDVTSIGVPTAWYDVKPILKDPKQRALFEQAFKDQSTSAYLDTLAPEIIDKLDVFVVDGTTVISGSPSNLTITIQKNSLVKDLNTLDAVLPGQLPSVGATAKGTHRATIGGQDTLVVDYTTKTAKGEATGRQYDHFNGPDLVVVSFTALTGKEDLKLWEQIAGTVTVL